MDLIQWDKLKYQIETSEDITELSKLSPALEAVKRWAKQSGQSKKTQDAIGSYRIDLEHIEKTNPMPPTRPTQVYAVGSNVLDKSLNEVRE